MQSRMTVFRLLALIFALNRGGRSQIYHFLIIVSLPFSFFWKLQFIGVCESCGLFNLRLIKEIENFSYIFWKLAADFLKGRNERSEGEIVDLLDIRLYKIFENSVQLDNFAGINYEIVWRANNVFVNYESNIVRIALDTGMMKRSDII